MDLYATYLTVMASALVFAMLYILMILIGLADIETTDLDAGLDDADLFELPDTAEMEDAMSNAEIAFERPAGKIGSGQGRGGLVKLSGIGAAPFTVWALAFAVGFGADGLLMSELMPGHGPILMIVPLIFGLVIASCAARIFGALTRTVSTSVDINHMRHAKGIVVDGDMTTTSGSRVRIADRFGAYHHVNALPAGRTERIPQGQAVLVTRRFDMETGQSRFEAIPLD